jgi:hypothetical protein
VQGLSLPASVGDAWGARRRLSSVARAGVSRVARAPRPQLLPTLLLTLLLTPAPGAAVVCATAAGGTEDGPAAMAAPGAVGCEAADKPAATAVVCAALADGPATMVAVACAPAEDRQAAMAAPAVACTTVSDGTTASLRSNGAGKDPRQK